MKPCRKPPRDRWCKLEEGHEGRCDLNKVRVPEDPFGDGDRYYPPEAMQQYEEEWRRH